MAGSLNDSNNNRRWAPQLVLSKDFLSAFSLILVFILVLNLAGSVGALYMCEDENYGNCRQVPLGWDKQTCVTVDSNVIQGVSSIQFDSGDREITVFVDRCNIFQESRCYRGSQSSLGDFNDRIRGFTAGCFGSG